MDRSRLRALFRADLHVGRAVTAFFLLGALAGAGVFLATTPEFPDVRIQVRLSSPSSLATARPEAKGLTMRITDDDNIDFTPEIRAGKVVWGKAIGSIIELFLWDGREIRQLTSGSLNNVDVPRQGFDGKRVVWQSWDGKDSEIHLYDISMGQTRRLTDNAVDDVAPSLSGERIAWYQRATGVVLHNLATGETKTVVRELPDLRFGGVDGDVIAYSAQTRGTGTPGNVFLYNIVTGVTTTLENEGYRNIDPTIRDGMVLWRGNRGLETDALFLYDGQQVVKLAEAPYGAAFASARDADSHFAVWEQSGEIYVYEIATKTTRRLTNDSARDSQPSTHNGQAVWSSCGGNSAFCEIAYFDGQKVAKITDDMLLDASPSIHDGQVAWVRQLVGEGDRALREIFVTVP